MINAFPKEQYLILHYLFNNNKDVTINEMIEHLNLDQVFVSSSLQTLSQMGFVNLSEEIYSELSLSKEGAEFLDKDLPQKTVMNTIKVAGELHLKDLIEKSGLSQVVVGKLIKYLVSKQWVDKNGPNIAITNEGKRAFEKETDDEKAFKVISNEGKLVKEKAEKDYAFFSNGFAELEKAYNFFKIVEKKRKYAKLTDLGISLMKEGINELVEATQITPEIIKSNMWKDIYFKPYNIYDDSLPRKEGRIHPFQEIIDSTRKVYLEMGFTEITSPYVESAFWTFDALFQPQDHPAREMQDTFYIKYPGESNLPDLDLVNSVKDTHEFGGKTNSTGWKYKWDIEKAKKTILRTHTTAASIQHIYKNNNKPLKVFCLGYVFRRETIDYKHLPVFTQVDGIIVDENASLSNLIALIQEFYKKMGFNKIEVRPAFFPYTEPSLEIFVYMEEKKDWIEMGGAGIFRKEVTVPMGCDMPVLAWGLGLERLAMFKYKLNDIRDIYIANIKWLRSVSRCL